MPDLRGRRWLPPLGVALLVLLTIADVVLIRLAFEHVDRPAVPAGRATESSSPSARTSDPSPTIDASAEDPSVSTSATPAPDAPLLLALGSDTVVRAEAGRCGGGDQARVAVARPGATAWRALPVASDLVGVLAVRAESRDDLLVIGVDGECRISGYAGAAGRRDWAQVPAQDEWYLDVTQRPAEVHAPGGPVDVPCMPTALSALDAVRVLCEDGALLGTGDGGQTWAALGRVENASAMAFEGPSRGIALAERDDCPVTVLVTTNGGAGWEATTCLGGETGRAVALRGETAVAVIDDVLWRSADGGETWERSTG